MGGSSPRTKPSAPDCGDTLKAPATSVRSRVGIVLEDGSGVAIDLGHRPVVLLRTETARCTVRPTSGQERCCATLSERCRPWSWTLKRCCGKWMGPLWRAALTLPWGGKSPAPGCASKASRVSWWGARRTQVHEHLGCTQRQCEINQDIVDNYRNMFESIISVVVSEKLPCSDNLSISSWSYDMEGHAKKCVERYCELANKTTQQLHKVSTPCIDDHHFKEEETKSVGELSHVCSQIFPQCLYLARIGRPDILWSVNKLARSITKWTKACDKRLSRLVSCIHRTCDCKQYCRVGNTAKQCRLGLFRDSDCARDIEDSKSTSGGTLCIFGMFQPVGCARNKLQCLTVQQNQKSFPWMQVLRMDGIPALDLWDLIATVLHENTNQSKQVQGELLTSPTRKKIPGKIDDLSNVDFVPSNENSSRKEALLYVSEDTEAVIKMIVKGRSPTMRHVSRTHRVALD